MKKHNSKNKKKTIFYGINHVFKVLYLYFDKAITLIQLNWLEALIQIYVAIGISSILFCSAICNPYLDIYWGIVRSPTIPPFEGLLRFGCITFFFFFILLIVIFICVQLRPSGRIVELIHSTDYLTETQKKFLQFVCIILFLLTLWVCVCTFVALVGAFIFILTKKIGIDDILAIIYCRLVEGSYFIGITIVFFRHLYKIKKIKKLYIKIRKLFRDREIGINEIIKSIYCRQVKSFVFCKHLYKIRKIRKFFRYRKF